MSLVCAERLDSARDIVRGSVNARRGVGLELMEEAVSEAKPLKVRQRHGDLAVAF